jgi:hypothetical protein
VLQGGDGGAGELHGIMAELWEGLSWIGRGWGGLPTVDRGFAGEDTGGDDGSGARDEMRLQERAKWWEGKLLKVLDQKKKGGGGTHGASHDGGKVAAGQSSGRARAEAGRRGVSGRRPEEKSYGGCWPEGDAWELPEVGGGAGRAVAAVSDDGLRRQAVAGGSGSGGAAWRARGRPAGRG